MTALAHRLAHRLATARWHIARLPGRFLAFTGRLTWSRHVGVVFATRFGVPFASGMCVTAAASRVVPWWAVAMLFLVAAGLTLWHSYFNSVDQESRLADALAASSHATRALRLTHWAQELYDKNVRLHAELVAKDDDVAAYDLQCRSTERTCVYAWEMADEARRNAMHWRFKAQENEHWEAIAKQNASEGAKLAHVLIDHIAKLGDGTEVAKAHEALRVFEQSQN